MSTWTMRPPMGGSPPSVDSAARPLPARLNVLDLWAFVVPAVSFVEITILGRLIVSELLMVAMLPWLWGARDRLPLPRWFVILGVGWLLSQVVTDIVVGNGFEDFARGWAAIIFTLTDFAAILVLASTPRRARLFALGLAASGLLGYFLVPGGYAVGDPWKFAFAIPVGLAMAAGLSGSEGARHRWQAVIAFAAFGALNLFFGFRSLGGVSLLAAGYLAFGAVFRTGRVNSGQSVLRAAAGLAFLSLAVLGVLKLYDVAASGGLLGATALAKYDAQSGTFGVLLGGRSELLASTQAILDSPILGHGSWAKDFAYVDLLAQRASTLGYEIGAGYSDVGLIPAHSYLMQSWVWAGLLGAVFWLAIFGIAVGLLAKLYSFRVELAPLLVFSTLLLLWNIAFSPYGEGARLLACYGLALCLLGLRQVRRDDAEHLPFRPALWASRPPRRAPRSWGDGRAAASRDGRPAPDPPAGEP